MAGLQVKLLGGFDVRREPGAALRLPTKKTQALLAFGTADGALRERVSAAL